MSWLIGHLVGDYLLQNDWMAVNKKSPGWKGFIACFIHCFLWTLSVCLFTWWWKPEIIALVFLSHWILDRTQIVKWFIKVSKKTDSFWMLVVTDNVIHLVFLYFIAAYATYLSK